MEKMEFYHLPLLSNTFDSLPYLMSENDWIEMKKFKRLAILKEEQLQEERKKRHELLLLDVSNKLERWNNNKKQNGNQVEQSSKQKVIGRQSLKASGIPVRSPPKMIQTQLLKPQDYDARANHAIIHYSRAVKHTSRSTNPAVHFSALVKGYLTRRLLTSEKIQDIVKTIKDAEHVLQDLESPSTIQEFDLQQRVITQLQAAKHKLHFIFFEAAPKDKMAYIAHSRIFRKEKSLKKFEALQDGVGIRGRLSTATLKSIERKKNDSPTNVKTMTTKRPFKKQKEETKEGNKVKHELNTGRKSVSSAKGRANQSSGVISSNGSTAALRKKTTSGISRVNKQSNTTSKNSAATKIPSIRTRNPKLTK